MWLRHDALRPQHTEIVYSGCSFRLPDHSISHNNFALRQTIRFLLIFSFCNLPPFGLLPFFVLPFRVGARISSGGTLNDHFIVVRLWRSFGMRFSILYWFAVMVYRSCLTVIASIGRGKPYFVCELTPVYIQMSMFSRTSARLSFLHQS